MEIEPKLDGTKQPNKHGTKQPNKHQDGNKVEIEPELYGTE